MRARARSIALGRNELSFYGQNGYLVVERFIPEKECRSLIAGAQGIAAGRHANLLNIHERSPLFRRLLVHPGILKAADAIQKARMIPIGSIFFFCKPGNPLEKGANAHQDNYAAKAPYGSYFVCGVALDDADEGNGALVVYPGTHKLRDLPYTPAKNFEMDRHGKIVKAYPIGPAVRVPVAFKPLQLKYTRGSLIFIHGHLVHSAPQNPSRTRWRHKVYLHYIKDGDPFWPGWNARRRLIERDARPPRADDDDDH
ncbi:MAG: phytanoyl-CoA dioxygenase family protein [Elusimicrobia bacterium]|nr:phytanoyl-CoA dioxygenase family protein [Elusimicrobiota bacterium]